MKENEPQKKGRDYKSHRVLLTAIMAGCMLFTHSMLCASVFSQNKLNISLKNGSLVDVLQQIDQKTDYSVLYRYDQLEKINKLTIDAQNATVEEILNQCLKGTGLSYRISEKTIVISKILTQAPAQEGKEIKGRVTDSKKEPLIGATIMIKGTSIGVVTNENGEYSLKVPADTKALIISYIGYTPKNVTIGNTSTINVVLDENVVEMDDVVVTGYFNRSKSSFTGAMKTISKEEIQKFSSSNIFNVIKNIDAGFKLQENNKLGSDPNSIPDITIRGKGSFLNSSTAPVFIMDGFEVSSQKVFDMDVNRIESITLLKDASATILYGSRAANGVVVIETKAPASGRLRLTYDFKPTIAVADLTDYSLMDARQKLEFERLAGLYNAEDLYSQRELEKEYYAKYAEIERGVNTYWLSQPVRNAFSQTHSLFIEGGDNTMRYGIDANYNKNAGVMKESGRDRYGVGFSLIYRIKDKVTIKNYASYDAVHSYDSPFGSFSTYGKLNPYDTPFDANGQYRPKLSSNVLNPLYDAYLPYKKDKNSQTLIDQLNVDWFVIPDLRLKGSFKIQKDISSSENYLSPRSSQYVQPQFDATEGNFTSTPIEKRGQMDLSNGKGLLWTGNLTASYNKTLEGHTLFAGIGGEINYNENSGYGFSITGFPDDRYADPAFSIQFLEKSKPSSSESVTKSVGVFANFNYIYDNRYFADLSVRADGSSRFGSKNKYAPFYSFGAGWNIHNEKFWGKNNILNELKIRTSYGVTGNQEFSAYQALTTYQYNTDRLYNNTIGATLMGYGNENLKWQRQYMTNIGVDLRLVKNRIRISADHYIRKTDGLLTTITVAPSLGFSTNNYKENLGEIENKGFEVNLNAILIQNKESDLEWAISLQGATNKSKLLKISNELKGTNDANNNEKYTPLQVYEEGESMTAIKAVHSLGIDPANGKELFLTKEGQNTYTWNAKDKVICGDSEPKLFGNIATNIYYHNWNVNLTFQYRMGGDIYNETLMSRVEGADPKDNADTRVLDDRWKQAGDWSFYKDITDRSQSFVTSRFIQKENTLSLSSFSLSYDLTRDIVKHIGLQKVRLSFYMNDLFRLSSVKLERGLDYPFARSFVFGLNVEF